MAVTETLRGLGAWSLALEKAPQELISAINYFGHIAIHTGAYDYRVAGDSALTSSRYTGVLRKKEGDGDHLTIGGPGMAMWLGDEDKKGSVFESTVTITAQTFENSIRALLPASGSIIEGTLFNIAKNFTGSFIFVSPREAIDYVCDTLGAEWIVRGDGKIDAGLATDLFVTTPKTVVVRKEEGIDMALRALLGSMKTSQDVDDFTSRVLLLASGTSAATISASADILPGLNPYKDIRGNTVKFTRLISESATSNGNAPARAQLALNRFTGTRDALTLSARDYDIKGDVKVGDYIWVQDPELDLVDGNNEVIFKGKRYNPMKLRLTEMTWPVPNGMSVGYRDWVGKWWNLTDYLVPESSGDSTLVVGGYNRSLTSAADGGVVGSRPQPDLTIPAAPTWVTPFTQGVYQSAINGDTKAQVQLKWTRPNNTDASTITDGDHYEIRYRSSNIPIYPVTWSQLSGKTWGDLNVAGATWGTPLVYPVGPWNYATAPWSELTFLLQELTASLPYEVQIRAVDGAVPSNYGAWSTVSTFQTSGDTLAPSTPAPPAVAASRLAVQIIHTLGKASGGTYNLEGDLHHLAVYGEYEPNFTPSPATLLGKIIANNGMLTGQIPAVGTVAIERTVPTYFKVTAVDNYGNASQPSVAVQQIAQLVDDAHISDLTVSKVTAGIVQSDWLVGARIATGFTGARVEMNASGIRAYDSANNATVTMDSSNGNFDSVGSIKSGITGVRIEVNPVAGLRLPEIRMYPTSGSSYAYLNAFGAGGTIAGIGINSGSSDGVVQSTMYCGANSVFMGRATVGGPNPTKGGFFNGDDTNGIIGFSRLGSEALMQFGSDRHILLKGVLHAGNVFGAEQAIVCGHADSDAFITWNFFFGATMLNEINLTGSFCQTANSWNTDTAFIMLNRSQTGFSMSTTRGATGITGRFTWLMFQTN